MSKIPLGRIFSYFPFATVNPDAFSAPSVGLFQVESGKMKTLPLLFLLLASGACDDVKYISKRNSGRTEQLQFLLSFPPGLQFDLCRPSGTPH